MARQSIWLIGGTPSLQKFDLPPSTNILCLALSDSTCYFATSDGRLGHFPLDPPSDPSVPRASLPITYESMPDIAQLACGRTYVACRKSNGELWVRGAPFPETFTRVMIKEKDKPLPFVQSITGAALMLFAILSHGRFCVITDQAVLYQKRSQHHNWLISSAMFLGLCCCWGILGGRIRWR
jgi:hypothetical protein